MPDLFSADVAMRRTTGLAAVLVVSSALASGCGGDDQSTSEGAATPTATSTPTRQAPPTKAEYVAKVNAICSGKGDGAAKREAGKVNQAAAKAGKDLDAALASGAPTAPIFDRIGRIHVKIAESREAVGERIRELTPPRDGGPEAFLTAFDRVAVALRRFGEDAKEMDGTGGWQKTFQSDVAAINRAGAKAIKEARAYGVRRCAV